MRDSRFDNLKGLLIFLVVFGHSMEAFKSYDIISETLYMFIYMFHMPVFVFVSGYFSKNSSRSSAFTSILLPYILFNTVFNLITSVYLGIESFSFIVPAWALWYLLSLFFWRIIIKDLVKVKYILWISIIIGVLAGLSSDFTNVLSLSRTIVFFPFFIGGYLMPEEKLNIKINKILIFSVIVLTFIAAFVICKYTDVPVDVLYGADPYRKFTDISTIDLMLLRIWVYIIGFSFVYILINLVPNRHTILTNLGKKTFPVYVLHPYLLGIYLLVSSYISNIYINLILGFLCSALICFVLSRDIIFNKFNGLIKFINKLIMVQE